VKDLDAVIDFRTAAFDLDNVYGRGKDDQPYIYDGDKFLLGVKILGGSPHGAGAHDLPRNSAGRALIGDPRNDENSIVSQLQGLFLRLHNRAVDEVGKLVKANKDIDAFKTTQQMVRDHYQYVVMNDFLAKIVSDGVLTSLKTSNRWDANKLTLFDPKQDTPFMPVEFSVAAYRLGHSMVRPGYRLNDAIIEAIFPVQRQTGMNFPEGLTGFRPLITDWAIDWSRFIPIEERDYGPNPDDLTKPATEKQVREMYRRLQFAYKIDTSIVDPLGSLPKVVASDPPPSLAERNLKRGAQFSLPTGQEAAKAMKLTPLPDDKILIGKASSDAKPVSIADVAKGAFNGKCPLWTYILAEAMQNAADLAIPARGASGKVSTPQLGPVGGRIVAETFLALIHADERSFVSQAPEWKPQGARFGLRELVIYALGDAEVQLKPRVLLNSDGEVVKPLPQHRAA
jgi:Animal haem peroxidase